MLLTAAVASICCASAVVAVDAQPARETPAEFYAGKTFTIIVGSDSGGGYDANARVMARHLGRHIPGNPNVIVKNMPGAGSIIAANHIYNVAPKDGTVIGLIQRGNLMAKITRQSVQFDLEKIQWVGNLSSEPGLIVAWHTAPHRTADDLFKTELTVGGSGAVGENETIPRLLNAFIGTKFRLVSGYPSNAAILLAMERGEVQGVADWTWGNIKARRPEFLRDQKIHLLMLVGIEREPDLPDVPLPQEYAKNPADRQAMEVFFALKTVARPIMAAPGVPEERMRALREAFMAMARDPAFLQDAQKSGVDVDPTAGDVVQRVVQKIAATPADVAKRLADAIMPNR